MDILPADGEAIFVLGRLDRWDRFLLSLGAFFKVFSSNGVRSLVLTKLNKKTKLMKETVNQWRNSRHDLGNLSEKVCLNEISWVQLCLSIWRVLNLHFFNVFQTTNLHMYVFKLCLNQAWTKPLLNLNILLKQYLRFAMILM